MQLKLLSFEILELCKTDHQSHAELICNFETLDLVGDQSRVVNFFFFFKLSTTLDLQIRGLYYSVLSDRQCIRVLTTFSYVDLDGSPVAMRLQSLNIF